LVKNSAKATTVAGRPRPPGLGHRALAEQVRRQRVGRQLQQVRQLFEIGQLADQGDDGVHVARLGGAQGMGGGHGGIVHPRGAGVDTGPAAPYSAGHDGCLPPPAPGPRPGPAGAGPAPTTSTPGATLPGHPRPAAAADAARLDGRGRVVPVRRRRAGAPPARSATWWRPTGAASAARPAPRRRQLLVSRLPGRPRRAGSMRWHPGMPVDLLGHSMGGNVVMSYAGVRPQRIRRLVNLEGFGLPDMAADQAPGPPGAVAGRTEDAAAARPTPSRRRWRSGCARTTLACPPTRRLAGHALGRAAIGRPVAPAGRPRAQARQPGALPRGRSGRDLARITAPLLWVEGAQTGIAPSGGATAIHGPNSKHAWPMCPGAQRHAGRRRPHAAPRPARGAGRGAAAVPGLTLQPLVAASSRMRGARCPIRAHGWRPPGSPWPGGRSGDGVVTIVERPS
jgi:pimeloyl-ACP methyl ester carboxylesterase